MDFTIQSLSLYQLMERGYPQNLVYCYAGLIAMNVLVYAIGVLTPRYYTTFRAMLIDYMYVLSWMSYWFSWCVSVLRTLFNLPQLRCANCRGIPSSRVRILLS